MGNNVHDTRPVYVQNDSTTHGMQRVVTKSGQGVAPTVLGHYTSDQKKFVPGTLGTGMNKADAVRGVGPTTTSSNPSTNAPKTTTSTASARSGFGSSAVGSSSGG